jgi:hypothetical protein
MAQELGKVNKPEVESFKHGRKLLVIPLLYASKDSPQEYLEKFDLYWKQVSEQVTNLEIKMGSITRVFHESISLDGEEGLKIVQQLNDKSYQIAKERCQKDAKFEMIEDRELAEECMDWERCLLMGFISEKAAKIVSDFYVEASKKRHEYIGKKIDEKLKAGDVAILFIREGHMVQFPKDIDVFSVAPPALDEIHRWVRDRMASKSTEVTEEKTEEKPQEKAEKKPKAKSTDSNKKKK